MENNPSSIGKGNRKTLLFIAFFLTTVLGFIYYIQSYIHFQKNEVSFPYLKMLFASFSSFYIFLIFVPIIRRLRRQFDIRLAPFNVLWHVIFGLIIAFVHLFLATVVNQLIVVQSPSNFFAILSYEIHQELLFVFVGYLIILAIDYFIENFRKFINSEEDIKLYKKRHPVAGEIIIRSQGQQIKINASEILYCEALDNYVKIYTKDEFFTIRKTLKLLLNELKSDGFVRIHRSFIVNSKKIRKIKSLKGGDSEIELENDQKLKLSRTYRKNLKANFED